MISDGHCGIQLVVITAYVDASWQMCQVHTTRATLRTIPKKDQQEIADQLREPYGSDERLQVGADPLDERGYRKGAIRIERFLP